MSGYIKACDDRGYSPEARIKMMMPIFKFTLDRVTIPRFPVYGMTTSCGLNFHLAEEILSSVQARLYLYFLTPDTGTTTKMLLLQIVVKSFYFIFLLFFTVLHINNMLTLNWVNC